MFENEICMIIAMFLAISAVVLAFIFIIPEKKREKMNKIGKFFHDLLNFKYLIIEKVLQAIYLLLTAFTVFYGFLMLFYVEDRWYGSDKWYGGEGILLMIFGPIVVRIIYESLMLAVIAVKNLISINNKIKNQNDGDKSNDPFSIPKIIGKDNLFQDENVQSDYYTTQNEQAAKYCPNCGSVVEEGAFCPKCGNRV